MSVRRAVVREDAAICTVSALDGRYRWSLSREAVWIFSLEDLFESRRLRTRTSSWWTWLVWSTNDSGSVRSRWFEQLSLLMMCLISSHRDYSMTFLSSYTSISWWRTWATGCEAFRPREVVYNRKTTLRMWTRPSAVAVADVEEERYSNDTDDAYELLRHDRVI